MNVTGDNGLRKLFIIDSSRLFPNLINPKVANCINELTISLEEDFVFFEDSGGRSLHDTQYWVSNLLGQQYIIYSEYIRHR